MVIEVTAKRYRFYCHNCFAESAEECICERIEGYHPDTGYPIVSITDEEWNYIYSTSGQTQKKHEY
jgi:hypothetical protein